MADGHRDLFFGKNVSPRRKDAKQQINCRRGVFKKLGVFAPWRDPLLFFSTIDAEVFANESGGSLEKLAAES